MAKINMFAALNSNFKDSIDLTAERKSQESFLTKRKRGRPPKSFINKEKKLSKIRPFEDLSTQEGQAQDLQNAAIKKHFSHMPHPST